MHSRYVTATFAMLFVASCGGDPYGSSSGAVAGDDEDTQEEEGSTNRDAGARDARTKDAGRGDGGSWEAGGGSTGGAEDAGSGTDDAPSTDAGAEASKDAGGDSCATLTYQAFGKQFVSDYCLSCHGGAAPRGGFKLDTLAAVDARRTGVKAQVLSGGMPMGSKRPSDAERARFGQWIDCGPK